MFLALYGCTHIEEEFDSYLDDISYDYWLTYVLGNLKRNISPDFCYSLCEVPLQYNYPYDVINVKKKVK